MEFEVFMLCLLASSLLTGVVVESIKKLFDERGKSYHSNALAGICSVPSAGIVFLVFLTCTECTFDLKMCVTMFVLMFCSWICSMIGYDKFVQTFSQLKTVKDGE